MPLATAAANAMMTPTPIMVVGSVLPNPMAAVEAISRLEGPANGMRLNPNAVAKMISKSIGVAMLRCPRLVLEI